MNIKYVMIPDWNSFFRAYVDRLPKLCFSLFGLCHEHAKLMKTQLRLKREDGSKFIC